MRWEFKQEPGEAHGWRWQCVDADTGSILKMSPIPFKSMDDCIRDAEKNGYKDYAPGQSPLNHDMANAALFERMVADLRLRGMRDSDIEQARKHWTLTSAAVGAFPCPICYLSGRAGMLPPTSADDGLERVKCNECGETIQLSPASGS